MRGSSYDEERRLMYVAMTRAENYLYISAEKERTSHFYQNLNLEEEKTDNEPEELDLETEEKQLLEIEKPEEEYRKIVTPSQEIEMSNQKRKSTEKGDKLHKFLEEHVKNNRNPKLLKKRRLPKKLRVLMD